jgi:hypothetical protein
LQEVKTQEGVFEGRGGDRLKTKWFFFSLCVACGLVVGLALGAEASKGPEKITIDINKSGKAVKNFPHWKHQELLKGDCIQCHHTSKPGEEMKKCSSCHTDINKKNEQTKAIGFKDAAHKKCQECHKKQKDKPDLKKCTTCHKS